LGGEQAHHLFLPNFIPVNVRHWTGYIPSQPSSDKGSIPLIRDDASNRHVATDLRMLKHARPEGNPGLGSVPGVEVSSRGLHIDSMQPDSESTAVIQRLLEHHVPEIGTGAVEIRGIAREPGKRTMIAVESKVPSVDAVGSCTGVRGTRVRAMLGELPGEHMDIVLWNDELQRFLGNLLAPNRAIQVSLDPSARRATVSVPPDCTPFSEVRLRVASKLVGWDLKIITPAV